VKRIPAGLTAVLAVLATGMAASACQAAPTAASVNGAVITVASLNTQLGGLTSTAAGQCLLSLNAGRALDLTGTGAGGAGTYQLSLAAAVLDNRVYNLLAAQFLIGHGAHVSAQDRAQAESTFVQILSGEISAQAQQAAAVGGTAGCQRPNGTPYTGKTLLADLPSDVRSTELANQVVEQYLLAQAAALTPAALEDYFLANPTQFVTVCVSVVQTTDQATADTAYNSLKGGAPLDKVAAAASANPAVQSRSGPVGCTSEASVLSQLQLPSVVVGQPVTPLQANGTWLVYVITSQTPVPFDQAAPTIAQILMRSTANQQKVTNAVVGFARTSSVEINPQYGSWTSSRVTPPTPPKAQYLLPFYGSTITVPANRNPGTSTSTPGSGSTAG